MYNTDQDVLNQMSQMTLAATPVESTEASLCKNNLNDVDFNTPVQENFNGRPMTPTIASAPRKTPQLRDHSPNDSSQYVGLFLPLLPQYHSPRPPCQDFGGSGEEHYQNRARIVSYDSDMSSAGKTRETPQNGSVVRSIFSFDEDTGNIPNSKPRTVNKQPNKSSQTQPPPDIYLPRTDSITMFGTSVDERLTCPCTPSAPKNSDSNPSFWKTNHRDTLFSAGFQIGKTLPKQNAAVPHLRQSSRRRQEALASHRQQKSRKNLLNRRRHNLNDSSNLPAIIESLQSLPDLPLKPCGKISNIRPSRKGRLRPRNTNHVLRPEYQRRSLMRNGRSNCYHSSGTGLMSTFVPPLSRTRSRIVSSK